MHVSTLVRRCSALLLVLAAATACSDAPMAPRAAERPAFDIDALQPESYRGGQGNHTSLSPSDTEEVITFAIDPNVSRTYAFGENWVYFPAHSICDPATTTYGIGMWDAPCTPSRQPVRVTVHWSHKGGHAYARFAPELRFVPADAGSVPRWVILSLHDHKRIHALDDYKILYDAGAKGWIDESLTDPTLRAWIDPLHNSVVRRVKHFSGYMVAAGAMDSGLGGMSYASY